MFCCSSQARPLTAAREFHVRVSGRNESAAHSTATVSLTSAAFKSFAHIVLWNTASKRRVVFRLRRAVVSVYAPVSLLQSQTASPALSPWKMYRIRTILESGGSMCLTPRYRAAVSLKFRGYPAHTVTWSNKRDGPKKAWSDIPKEKKSCVEWAAIATLSAPFQHLFCLCRFPRITLSWITNMMQWW